MGDGMVHGVPRLDSGSLATGGNDPDRPGTLVFACGNPSRGDDALGPSLLQALEQGCASGELDGVELLTDFQLQIEHALDLVGRERVLFVDAAASGLAPFAFDPVSPSRDLSYSSHAMSPAAVLATYEQVVGEAPPPVWLLAIRGYEFGLGKGLSGQASDNLERALAYVRGFLSAGSVAESVPSRKRN